MANEYGVVIRRESDAEEPGTPVHRLAFVGSLVSSNCVPHTANPAHH
jgi:hypothetical protein